MSQLTIIGDPKSFEGKNYITRHTARAVLSREDGKIAILHVGKYNYHKLPGGGVEEGEDIESALRRECMEEVGADIADIKIIGEIIEWRNGVEEYNEGVNIKQISHCFGANVVGYHQQNLTEYEKFDESEILWMPIETAIWTLEHDIPANIEGEWIIQRELTFLKNI